jgi:hypothetical protein
MRAQDEKEKSFLASILPTAWGHINLLGNYQFCTKLDIDWIEQYLNQWDWKNSVRFKKKEDS